ncbi:thioesterase II family protein [Streptomyces violens]|uniref:thioesterase II family protein n=1 Tax=Streptomyces violens TaxID=66377 RepID=UPI0004BFF1B7|nr:alpha/beta fold hydrolase [Streptomyces violens]
MEPTYLICLPFAGAGASFFKEWQQHVPEGLSILPVQLPGREERFIDAPHTDAARAAEEASSWVMEQIDGSARVALFGHSLGAVLAYELAHQLSGMEGVRLAHLFVSGSPGPWNGRESRATGLDDEGFLAQVRRFAGYSHPALENPEMRELLLPMLRADVEMHESYRPASDKPLSASITSLRGREDELVDAAQIAQWEQATTGTFTTAELDGGHMYLADGSADLLQLIGAKLSATES